MAETMKGPIERTIDRAKESLAEGVTPGEIEAAIRRGWSDWPIGAVDETIRLVRAELFGRLLMIDGRFAGTVGDFFDANDGLDPDEARAILDLDVGESTRIGGGAFAEVTIRRVEDRSELDPTETGDPTLDVGCENAVTDEDIDDTIYRTAEVRRGDEAVVRRTLGSSEYELGHRVLAGTVVRILRVFLRDGIPFAEVDLPLGGIAVVEVEDLRPTIDGFDERAGSVANELADALRVLLFSRPVLDRTDPKAVEQAVRALRRWKDSEPENSSEKDDELAPRTLEGLLAILHARIARTGSGPVELDGATARAIAERLRKLVDAVSYRELA